MSTFTSQIDAFTRKTETRMDAVFKTALQDLAIEANTPRGQGGNTPLDTSFLVNSFAAAVNSIPSGQATQPANYRATDFDMMPITAAILSANLGDRVAMGWVAEYSVYMEARYGFMRLAAQKWPELVDNAVRKVRAEYK